MLHIFLVCRPKDVHVFEIFGNVFCGLVVAGFGVWGGYLCYGPILLLEVSLIVPHDYFVVRETVMTSGR